MQRGAVPFAAQAAYRSGASRTDIRRRQLLPSPEGPGTLSLGLQIAQSRPYLHTLGPKVGIIYIHGALGYYEGTRA